MSAQSGKSRSVQKNGTPLMKPMKSGGSPSGRQAAADVGDEEDEEDGDVDRVLALGVGLEQRPDEEHARARGADDVGQDRADEEEERVDLGRRPEVAA